MKATSLLPLIAVSIALAGCATTKTITPTEFEDEMERTIEPVAHYVATVTSADFGVVSALDRMYPDFSSLMAPAMAQSLENAFVDYSPFLNPVVDEVGGEFVADDLYFLVVLRTLSLDADGYYIMVAYAYLMDGSGTFYLAQGYTAAGYSAWHHQAAQDAAVKHFMTQVYDDILATDFSNPPEMSAEDRANLFAMFEKFN